MYLVMLTSKDYELVESLKVAIRKEFPKYKFSSHLVKDRGYQLHLDGNDDETKPAAYSAGFCAAWNSKEKETVEDSNYVENKE